jgi:hypothetical protein
MDCVGGSVSYLAELQVWSRSSVSEPEGGLDLVASPRGLFPPHRTLGRLLQDAFDGAFALLDGALRGALDVEVYLALPLRQLLPRGLVQPLGGDGCTRLLVQVGQGVPVSHLQVQ